MASLDVEAGELVLDAGGREVDGEALFELSAFDHRDGLRAAAPRLLAHEEHPLPLLLLGVEVILQLQIWVGGDSVKIQWQKFVTE